MFNQYNPIPNDDLQNLKKLLEQKFENVAVSSVTSVDNEISVKILNGRHGVNEPVDEENERPIEYLKSFDANVSKEKAQHNYWSYSIVKFDESKLKAVIDGLKLMQDPNLENKKGKLVARC